jgi:hypothetical protein
MGSSASWGLRRRNLRWLDIFVVLGNRPPKSPARSVSNSSLDMADDFIDALL